jgi:hypothetical protein
VGPVGGAQFRDDVLLEGGLSHTRRVDGHVVDPVFLDSDCRITAAHGASQSIPNVWERRRRNDAHVDVDIGRRVNL